MLSFFRGLFSKEEPDLNSLLLKAEQAVDEAEEAVKATNKRILVLKGRLADVEDLALKLKGFGHDTTNQQNKIRELTSLIKEAEKDRNHMLSKVNDAVKQLRFVKKGEVLV